MVGSLAGWVAGDKPNDFLLSVTSASGIKEGRKCFI